MNSRLVALGLIVLCGMVVWQVTIIPSTRHGVVGPSLVPTVLAVLFSILSLIYALQAFRGKSSSVVEKPLPGALLRWLYLFASGGVMVILIPVLGFVVPVAFAAVFVARAFGAGFGLKTWLICLAISVITWFGMSQLLGVNLGPFFQFNG